ATLSSLAPARLEVNRPDVRIESIALADSVTVGRRVILGKISRSWMTGQIAQLNLAAPGRRLSGRYQAGPRDWRTIETYCAARSRIRVNSPLTIALGSTKELPIPRQQAPASRKLL